MTTQDFGTQFFNWLTGANDGSGQAAGAALYQAGTPFEAQLSTFATQYPDEYAAAVASENAAVAKLTAPITVPLANIGNVVKTGAIIGGGLLALMLLYRLTND